MHKTDETHIKKQNKIKIKKKIKLHVITIYNMSSYVSCILCILFYFFVCVATCKSFPLPILCLQHTCHFNSLFAKNKTNAIFLFQKQVISVQTKDKNDSNLKIESVNKFSKKKKNESKMTNYFFFF